MFLTFWRKIIVFFFPEKEYLQPICQYQIHPKYLEPWYENGKYIPPPIKGLVTVYEICQGKTAEEIKKLYDSCKDRKRKKALRQILAKKQLLEQLEKEQKK